MRELQMPNRDKTTNELTRRYEEVLRKSDGGIHNDEDAQQFISLVAHYVYYVKKSNLTQKAVTKLLAQHELLASDKVIVDEAEKLINQLAKDRKRVVAFAKKHGINTGIYEFNTTGVAQQITKDKEVSFHLTFLDTYLNLPSDQQLVSELPQQFSRLESIIFAITQQVAETKMLKDLRSNYKVISKDFDKKLKMQGVYLDYLRIEDYKAIELIWREVYHEGDPNELLMFYFVYGDLFEKNRTYPSDQQGDADDFLSKHVTHLQRVHNYLIDSLEDVPFGEKMLHWVIEHFGPTLVSLILIILLSLLLGWLGVSRGVEELRSLLGL